MKSILSNIKSLASGFWMEISSIIFLVVDFLFFTRKII